MAADEHDRLRRSWVANASAWSETVRGRKIESRRLATDDAIVAAVLEQTPRTVLDLGCGEGWLARRLASEGVSVTGIDASPALIDAARSAGGAEYRVAPYDDLGLRTTYDVIVANFALLDDRVEALLGELRAHCHTLIIQTVHSANVEGPYEDGWREETFAAMDGSWPEAMPWFFRTLSSWLRMFRGARYSIVDVREPLHPERRRPLSILFVLRPDP